MASFGTQSVAKGVDAPIIVDTVMIASIMNRVRAQAAADPFSNPILLFALELTLRIDRGEITLDSLENLVQRLTVEAFTDRAERLGAYLGETRIAMSEQAITALIENKAQAGSFEEFRETLGRILFGVVFTAHPTFSIAQELAHNLVELATGATAEGALLNQVGREERLAMALNSAHRPPEELSLEIEHAWVTEALNHAHDALEAIHRTALKVARERWPDEWAKLEPRLVTLASWVGYDQDGRTDVTWTRTIAARLDDKLGMI
jgi:phosphoenolpyruvate carboxylase